MDDITKDLHRQFPCHEMFATQGGWGQKNLYNVLIAYATHNPDVGYCQAMAPLAAVLLMHMPEEQAFWSLVSICDRWVCLRERERKRARQNSGTDRLILGEKAAIFIQSRSSGAAL